MSDSKYDQMFNQPNFDSANPPLSSTKSSIVQNYKTISLTLDDISQFALNPRRTHNPKYDEIKESIRAIGLENTLVVTKRPGEAGYTLFNGGNTRLRILKELWQETKDPKYFHQDCRFIPYSSDAELLIRHMVENETRGDMLFVDKALAAYQVKQFFEAETGKKLSVRALAERLSQQGWQISHVLAHAFVFAAQYLSDRIPLALAAGMGRPKIQEIRTLYHAIKRYVDEKLAKLNILSGDEAQELFLATLAEFDDGEYFDTKDPLNEFCALLSKKVNIDKPRIHFEIMHVCEHGDIYKGASSLDQINDLGQKIDNQSNVENAETEAENTSAKNHVAVINQDKNEESGSNVADAASSAGQEIPISANDRPVDNLIAQIQQLHRSLPLTQDYILVSTEPPYILPTEDAPTVLLQAIEQRSDKLDIDNVAENTLIEAAVLIEVSSFCTSWYRLNLAYSDNDGAKAFWKQCLEQMKQSDALLYDLRQMVAGYRWGFWQSDKIVNVLNQFDRLRLCVRAMTDTDNHEYDKDSS